MRTSTNNNTSPPSNGDHGIPASNEANDSLSKSSSSNAVPPNLLLKMLEACARHKRRHEFENKNQSTSAEEGRSREQKCLGELNQFASFLPRIETTVNIREESYSDEYQYYHPRGEEEEREEEGTMMRGGFHPTNRDYTKYVRSNNDQDDAGNLCSLYRFIARGSFCPKAVDYLFGDQSSATGTATINAPDGVEDIERKDIELARGILPRITKLLQFLSLDPVRMALLPVKLPHRSSKSKTMPRQIGHDALKSYYQDEDIGSTIASLLALFQSKRFLLEAVQDLINLSNDLNVIDESRVLFNPPTSSSIQRDKMENTTRDDAQSKIRVRLFTEISSSFHQNDVEKSISGEFIHIHSQRSLLALQCGVWVALQRLIPIISDTISLSSSVGEETSLSLLESARLALSSRALSPETEVLGWRYSPFDLSVHSLLSLRTKLGIAGLLRSMVNSNSGSNKLLGSAISPSTIELSVLAVEAAKLQMSRNRTTSLEGSIADQNNTAIHFVTDLESDLNSIYSWAASSLLVSAVVLPDYAPSSKDMIWLHCFPYVIDCVSHMAGANGKLNNTGDESLGHVVLHLIRVIMLRARKTSNSSVPKLLLHRCHVRGFFLQLFELAKDSSEAISSSAISLLIDLFGYHDSEAAHGNDIEILCRNAIESVEGSDSNDNQMDIDDAVNMANSMHLGNKRRRLQDTKKGTDTAISHDSSIQAAFAHAVADAMRGSYAIVKKLSAQKSHGPSGIVSSLNESDIGLLRCITGVLRILCSLRSEISVKTTFRYTDEAIASLFQCIERVCDVLANPKGENGHMQYVETPLLPTALSLVVNVGLHACLLRYQDDTDFLNVSAREAISHCALAAVSLIADDQNENIGRAGDCPECFILGMASRLDDNDADSQSVFGEESIDIALHSR